MEEVRPNSSQGFRTQVKMAGKILTMAIVHLLGDGKDNDVNVDPDLWLDRGYIPPGLDGHIFRYRAKITKGARGQYTYELRIGSDDQEELYQQVAVMTDKIGWICEKQATIDAARQYA